MTIAFVHNNKALLPEIYAYGDFFSRYNIKCEVVNKNELQGVARQVEWFFMGFDTSKRTNGIVKIHEYASASIPPARHIKDRVKKYINTQPDFRLFLNEYVRSQLQFNDHCPWGYRDMGLHPSWLTPPAEPVKKEYDFVYCGSVTKDIAIHRLLNHFLPSAPMARHSLLVVSRNYETLQQQYKAASNIQFTGPVPHHDVLHFIRKSHFAINYKPDIEPHSYQTVTKLLEYVACKTPVITTTLPWITQFQQRYGGNFFYLEPDLSNFTWQALQQFNFSFSDLSEWTWEKQIRGSGVLSFLESKFEGLKF
jgi:hypothetical protein